MSQFNILEAKEKLVELVQKAVFGEEIIITENDEPIVQLIGLSPKPPQRQFGIARGLITINGDFNAPLDEFTEYQ